MTTGSRRVLVTGAGGYLGGALTRALLAAGGLEVVALARNRCPPPAVTQAPKIDLTEQPALTTLLGELRPDAILHAAGRVHGPPVDLFRENAVASVALAEAVLAACPNAIVTALGSAAEYGRPPPGVRLREDAPLRPVSIYGHAKAAAARYLLAAKERGLRVNLVRVFNPVGIENSPDQVLGALINKLLLASTDTVPRSVKMGPLCAVRDFVVLNDVAALIVRLVRDGRSGHVINACSGKGYRVRDLVNHVLRTSKLDVEIIEATPPSSPAIDDVVIGDPAQFVRLSGLAALSSVEDTLDAAWRRAKVAT